MDQSLVRSAGEQLLTHQACKTALHLWPVSLHITCAAVHIYLVACICSQSDASSILASTSRQCSKVAQNLLCCCWVTVGSGIMTGMEPSAAQLQ